MNSSPAMTCISPALALGVFSWPRIFGEYNFWFMFAVLDRLFCMGGGYCSGWVGWRGRGVSVKSPGLRTADSVLAVPVYRLWKGPSLRFN